MIWRESAGEADQLDAIHRLPPHCNTALAPGSPVIRPTKIQSDPAGATTGGHGRSRPGLLALRPPQRDCDLPALECHSSVHGTIQEPVRVGLLLGEQARRWRERGDLGPFRHGIAVSPALLT